VRSVTASSVAATSTLKLVAQSSNASRSTPGVRGGGGALGGAAPSVKHTRTVCASSALTQHQV
jgi:hypothetical protein